jgi:hypothetical protein
MGHVRAQTILAVIVAVSAASARLAVSVAALSVLSGAAAIAQDTPPPTVVSVNGEVVSRRDLDRLLEQRGGPEVLASVIQGMLIDQEAKRLNVVPSEKEIEDACEEAREVNWQLARELDVKPWLADDHKTKIRLGIEKSRILAHEIGVTDEMRREEYMRNPSRYDTPNRARAQFALVLNEQHLQDVKQLMEKGINPQVIMANLKGAVIFIGYDSRLTVMQPLGDTNQNRNVFEMKSGEVRAFPPGEFARLGAKGLVVRLIDKAPGKKADLSDPKTKESLTLAVALQRAKPWKEYLSVLFANAKMEWTDPELRRNVELVLFPESAPTPGPGARPPSLREFPRPQEQGRGD